MGPIIDVFAARREGYYPTQGEAPLRLEKIPRAVDVGTVAAKYQEIIKTAAPEYR